MPIESDIVKVYSVKSKKQSLATHFFIPKIPKFDKIPKIICILKTLDEDCLVGVSSSSRSKWSCSLKVYGLTSSQGVKPGSLERKAPKIQRMFTIV